MNSVAVPETGHGREESNLFTNGTQHRIGGKGRILSGVLMFIAVICLALPAHGNDFQTVIEQAQRFSNLRTLHIAQAGDRVLERAFNGASIDTATNVKSASKTLVAGLVGVAIERGILAGTDQRVARLLADQLPANHDPRLDRITIGHLLSMQAGLERTSGRHYGPWVNSDNWVRAALSRPFVGEPGGRMLYSTGSTHLLSAILTRATGRPTYELANDWLRPAGVRVDNWMADPQGIPLCGNQVWMTPLSLLNLGELYRRGGITERGERLLSEEWIEASWRFRTRSRYTHGGYGYGWFLSDFGGHPGHYGWGYGGQMLYVVPTLELTVVITSDPNVASGRTGYREDLNRLLAEHIVPVAEARLGTLANHAPTEVR